MVQWLRNLGHSLTGLFNLFGGLWTKAVEVKDKTLHLFDDIHSLISDVETIVSDIQNFSINPKWNSRVILVPKMIEHIQQLYDVPMRIINDVKDLIRLLKEKIEPAEVNLEDVKALDGVPTKLLRACEKILGWATLIIDSLLAIESAVADLQDIATELRQTLEDLNGLDALFLPQGSTKKTVDVSYRKRQRRT